MNMSIYTKRISKLRGLNRSNIFARFTIKLISYEKHYRKKN